MKLAELASKTADEVNEQLNYDRLNEIKSYIESSSKRGNYSVDWHGPMTPGEKAHLEDEQGLTVASQKYSNGEHSHWKITWPASDSVTESLK